MPCPTPLISRARGMTPTTAVAALTQQVPHGRAQVQQLVGAIEEGKAQRVRELIARAWEHALQNGGLRVFVSAEHDTALFGLLEEGATEKRGEREGGERPPACVCVRPRARACMHARQRESVCASFWRSAASLCFAAQTALASSPCTRRDQDAHVHVA